MIVFHRIVYDPFKASTEPSYHHHAHKKQQEGGGENHFYGFHFVVTIIVFAIIDTSNKIHIYSLNVLWVLIENVIKIVGSLWEGWGEETIRPAGDQIFRSTFHKISFTDRIFAMRIHFDYDKLKKILSWDGSNKFKMVRKGEEKCQLDLCNTMIYWTSFTAESLRPPRKTFVLLHY